MADEQIVTNIVATADFSNLIADVHKVTASLSQLQQSIVSSNKMLANQIAVMNRSFSDTLRSTGQFSTHFVSLTSDVEKFGKNLDGGKLKLSQYFDTFRNHVAKSGGVIRDLARQQVQLQNSVLQPLGKNAQGLMQFNVHVPRGLDEVKNKTAIARQELQIMNKVMQDGANSLINWGKNTQWAGRQLTVGLTVPIAAFGAASAKAFREADQELTRLTKVYGDVAGTSAQELSKVRQEVTQTSKELSSAYGVNFKETIALAADIAATGKTGNELLGSVRETSRLAVLGEVDRQEAMQATLAIQSAFKQNTDELAKSINFLNAVENQTSTTLNDLVEAIPKAGPVIKGLGGSVQDLALYLTAMREGGVNASEGANALKSALASLINPTDVAVKKFEGFGIDLLGIVNSNAGNVTETLLALQASLDKLDPLQKQQAIEQLFGKFQFSRLNALFENLGKQGSQTLKVLDLMKTSSAELESVASRELTAVTESASGKYKRALESVKAELATVGESFLTVGTFMLNTVEKVLELITNLPKPIKQILTFLGGMTAVAGPLIMLTGVLANFFGYIVKGAMHFKALFKGGEGWKYLTPEIVAAEKASKMFAGTMYEDAKAASVLQMALRNLIDEFTILEGKAKSGNISVAPALTTMAGNLVSAAGPRVVDKNHPLVGEPYSRASTHMNPRAGMTDAERMNQTVFGFVPGSIPLNRKIGDSPQIYMNERLPDVEGLTSVRGASTGVVASEAAKHHTMMAALGMQSKAEIAELKKTIATTGALSKDFMQTFDDILPAVSQITDNAAKQSAAIVAQLRAGKINVEQARAQIIALNADIERQIGTAVTAAASNMGRTINLTQVPTLDQPVVNAAGKSNMRELFKKSKTKDFIDAIARSLGVRTSGAGYNIETTRPKKFNTGGYVYTMNDGNIVPGPNVNADVVPAMLTPGEFVVNREAAQANLPLLSAINGGMGSSGPGYMNGGQIQTLLNMPAEFLRRSMLVSGARRTDTRSGRAVFSPGAQNYDQMGSRAGRNSVWTNPILAAGRPNKDEVVGHIYSNQFYRQFGGPGGTGSSPRATGSDFTRLTGLSLPSSRSGYAGTYDILPNQFMTISRSFNTRLNRGGATPADWFASQRRPEHMLSLMELLTSQGIGPRQAAGIAQRVLGRINTNIGKLPANAVLNERMFGNIVTNSTRQEMMRLKGIGELNQRQAAAAPALPRGTYTPGAYRGYNRRNSGGMIRGYNRGGLVANLRMQGLLPGANSSQLNYQPDGTLLPGPGPRPRMGMGMSMGLGIGGSMLGGTIGQSLGGGTGAMIGNMAGFMLPQLISGIGNAVKGGGGLIKTLMSVGKILKSLTLPGALLTALGFLVKKTLDYKKQLEDIGKANRLAFGGTRESFASVGINNFKTVSERIKEVNDQLELHKAKVISTFESYTQAGPTGLTLTIKELREAIERAKTSQKDYVEAFNNIDSSRVVDYAAQMKAQFVAMGMSAQDATNQIYAIVKASDKAGQALSAISSSNFVAIKDQVSGIKFLMTNLKAELASQDFNAEEFNRGLDTLVSSVMAYRENLLSVKEDGKLIYNDTSSLAKVMEEINKLSSSRRQMSEDQIESLKNENIIYGAILGKAETLASVTAKILLYQEGFSETIDLASMAGADAVSFAKNLTTLREGMDAMTEDTSSARNPLAGLAKIIEKVKSEADKANTVVKKLKKVDEDYYKNKIESINKTIKALEKERQARLKALDVQEEAKTYEVQLSQAQIRYKQAVATGDLALAAQEQLSIEQLVGDRQRQLTRNTINDTYDAKIEKLQDQIESLRNQLDSINKSNAAKTANASETAAELATLQRYRDDLERIAIRNTGKAAISDADRKEISNIFKEMMDAGGAVAKAAQEMKAKYGVASSPDEARAGKVNFEQRLINDLNASVVNNNAGNKVFQTAVKDFALAVAKFAGLPEGTVKASDIKVIAPGRAGSRTVIPKASLEAAGVSLEKDAIFVDDKNKRYKITGFAGDNALLKRLAFGGIVNGPGNGTSDSIPAMLSDGEYVIKASAVNKYGKDIFDSFNSMKLASGGYVSSSYSMPSINTGGGSRYGAVAARFSEGGLATIDSRLTQSNNGTMGNTVLNVTNTYYIPESLTKEEVGRYIVDLQKKEISRFGVNRSK